MANGPARKVTLFRESFEGYSSYRKEPLEHIDTYLEMQGKLSGIILDIIKQGLKDGSIRSDLQTELALVTITNCFGIFSTKITLHKQMAASPAGITPKDQQTYLKDMLLSYIKG